MEIVLRKFGRIKSSYIYWDVFGIDIKGKK